MEKRKIKNTDENLENSNNASVGEMRSGFSALATQVIRISEEIAGIKEDLDVLRTDIEDVKNVSTDMNMKKGDQKSAFDYEERLAGEDISILKSDVMDIKMKLKDMDVMPDRGTSSDDVARDHEKRLSRMERKIRTMR